MRCQAAIEEGFDKEETKGIVLAFEPWQPGEGEFDMRKSCVAALPAVDGAPQMFESEWRYFSVNRRKEHCGAVGIEVEASLRTIEAGEYEPGSATDC